MFKYVIGGREALTPGICETCVVSIKGWCPDGEAKRQARDHLPLQALILLHENWLQVAGIRGNKA